jgi:hypothetical protein
MTAKAPILASKPPASLTTASPPPSQSQEPTTYNEDQSEIKLQIPDIDKTMQVFLTHFATALAAKFSNELGKRPQYVRDDVSSDEDSESWSEGEDSRKGRGERKKEKNKDDEKERTPAEMVDKLCKLDSVGFSFFLFDWIDGIDGIDGMMTFFLKKKKTLMHSVGIIDL